MKKLIVVLVLLVAIQANAREKAGNGGSGFICRSDDGKISSVHLLDIFEGSLPLYPRKTGFHYGSNELSVHDYIHRAVSRASVNNAYALELLRTIHLVDSSKVFLPSPAKLALVEDSFPEIRMKNCELAQIANYIVDDGVNHRIDIDEEYYSHMNTLHRAALIVHEAVYALSRANTVDDTSARSRLITAMLMADEDLSNELAIAEDEVIPETVDEKKAIQMVNECKAGSIIEVEIKITGKSERQQITAYAAGKRITAKSFGDSKAAAKMSVDCKRFDSLTWLVSSVDNKPHHYSVRMTLDGVRVFSDALRTTSENNSGYFTP